jgi:hypothetical protein
MKKNTLTKVITFVTVFVASFALFFTLAGSPDITTAQSGTSEKTRLAGWAWSSNIGWICFGGNAAGGMCPTAKVEIDMSSGGQDKPITGWAWSPNIGWIKFGGLSAFPGNGGDAEYSPGEGGKIIGWARACAGTASGDCTTMASRTDGWDGWISLDGPNYGLKIDMAGKKVVSSVPSVPSAYAWGSTVVGWISFDQMKIESGDEDDDNNNNTTVCTYTHNEGSLQTLDNGESITYNSNQACGQQNTRTTYTCTCTNGTCSAPAVTNTITNPACPTGPVTCNFEGGTLQEGQSVTRYSRSQVARGQSCNNFRGTLTCTDVNEEGQMVLTSPATGGGNPDDYTFRSCRTTGTYIEI